VPPQPSEIVPQSSPAGQVVIGVHPQTFAVPPPPQVSGAVHVPQSRVNPVQSPLAIVPQFLPRAAQVVGVQQRPKTAFPFVSVGFSQSRLQQLALV